MDSSFFVGIFCVFLILLYWYFYGVGAYNICAI